MFTNPPPKNYLHILFIYKKKVCNNIPDFNLAIRGSFTLVFTLTASFSDNEELTLIHTSVHTELLTLKQIDQPEYSFCELSLSLIIHNQNTVSKVT